MKKQILAGAVAATAVALVVAPSASADEYPYTAANAVSVCTVLDEFPGRTGVTMVAMTALNAGLDGEKAGRMIYHMVDDQCPSHIPDLLDWADSVRN